MRANHIAFAARAYQAESAIAMPTREAAPARRTVAMLIGLALLRGFVHDAESNFDIWQHKRYSNPPALAQGNGPIGKYRTWARQFYD